MKGLRRFVTLGAVWVLSGGCGRSFELNIFARFDAGTVTAVAEAYPISVTTADEEGEVLVRTVLCDPVAGSLDVTQNWSRPGGCAIPTSVELYFESVDLADASMCNANSDVDAGERLDDQPTDVFSPSETDECVVVGKLSSYDIRFEFLRE